MEKLRRWPACATATRIHSISGGSTRKGLRREEGRGHALGRLRCRSYLGPTPARSESPRPRLSIPEECENLWRHPDPSGEPGAGSLESLGLSFLICKTGTL
jgi:hypothetical protein